MKVRTGICGGLVALMAPLAFAAPPGVIERDGAWIAPDGKSLYTFARDVDGNSRCNGSCATAWPPLEASEDAVADGAWTVVTREDGSRMWAYRGRPVYTFARDTAGEPPSGVSAAWPLATK